MKITKEYLESRLEELKEERNKTRIKTIENTRKRHPAWKQLHGRIMEIERLIKKISE